MKQPTGILQRLPLYWRLVRMDRPIGIQLLLWPTLWAVLMASEGRPDVYVLFAFVTGTVLMRAAGCAINDWADRDFDRHVKRTALRPLTAGLIRPAEALAVFAVLALLAMLLLIPLNRLTWVLALFAVFLAVSYPFTKRFLSLPQAYLGIAFGFGIPMAYAAIQNSVPVIAWLQLLANIFWAIAYDTEYAMVDRDDDLRIGIKSSAITFGRFDVLAVMLCYVCMLSLMTLIAHLQALGPFMYFGLAAAAGLMAYHYRLIRDRDRDGCLAAFLGNNWVGLVIAFGLAMDLWFSRNQA